MTNIWVSCKLEYQTCKRFLVVSRTFDNFFFIIWIAAFHWRNIQRRRQIFYNSVKKWLHAHVTECSTTKNRHNCLRNSCFTYASFNFFNRKSSCFKIFVEKFFIFFCNRFKHFLAFFFVKNFHVFWNFFFPEVCTLGFFIEFDCFT